MLRPNAVATTTRVVATHAPVCGEGEPIVELGAARVDLERRLAEERGWRIARSSAIDAGRNNRLVRLDLDGGPPLLGKFYGRDPWGGLGRAFAPDELHRAFYATRFGRKVDRAGFVRFRHWRVYSASGLAGHHAAVWLYCGHPPWHSPMSRWHRTP